MALTIDVHHHIPYFRRDLAVAGRRELARTEALSAADREKVSGETARSRLPRLGRKERQ